MNFVRTHACCAQTREITTRFLRAFSRNRAKRRQFAREKRRELQSHFQRWHGKIYLHLREERQPVLESRTSRVLEYFSPNRVYANRRNSTRNRAISRVPARRYAISWVRARFALSRTISRKCNQQFRSGML